MTPIDPHEMELAKHGLQAVKDFFGKIAGVSAEEVGQLLADQVRFFRWKNQIKILQKAKSFLDEAGVNPKHVSLKILVPILDAGSLEEEEAMSDRWAALLAAAANPSSPVSVVPSFPEILKELSSKEAQLLDEVFDLVTSGVSRDEWATKGVKRDAIRRGISLSDQDLEVSVENLYRLHLCSPPKAKIGPIKWDEFPERRFQTDVKEIICLTELGYSFVSACRAPKKNP